MILVEPDHQPLPPKLIYQNDTLAKIHITPVINNNGPLSEYVVIVRNMNSVQTFDPENLKTYDEARRDGISYYIAVELDPQVCNKYYNV